MCGVVGVYSQSEPLDMRKLFPLIKRLHHRGPDESDVWLNDTRSVFLGHSRLSMVGLRDGSQPILNEEGCIAATVNGEFYGHRQIRSDLESRGHTFSTASDSEIVIHLYEESGLEFVKYLRGEFAFLLWDERWQRLIAVRDRFGIKPLVYTRQGDAWRFASEAKALLPDMQNADWDEEAVWHSLQMQYLPSAGTLFKGIQIIPPGHLAVVDQHGLHLQCYWELDYPAESQAGTGSEQLDEQTVIARIENLLRDSVSERMSADVPLAFHLSGGLDSSAILGIATSISSRSLPAYSICFINQDYDERHVALETAEFCGADLQLLEFSPEDLRNHLHVAARASEGLAINGHLPAKYLLNQRIQRDGFKGILSGEGADEVFLGYSHFRMDWCKSESIALNSDQFLAQNKTSLGMMFPTEDDLNQKPFRKGSSWLPTFLLAKRALGERARSLLNQDWLSTFHGRDAVTETFLDSHTSSQLQSRSPVHKAAWLWSRRALSGYILKTLADGTEMPFSLEGRLPFLDHLLFEYIRTLPLTMLMQGEIDKKILREAVKPYVTSTVYQRPKHPFDAPPLLLDDSPQTREFLWDQINSEMFRQQPFFDQIRVKDLLDKLPYLSSVERQKWDPVFMIMSTLIGLQEMISSRGRILTHD
ncbi:MAG: asparagine synthase (glutamine-hydrolyzing) [Planctomycetaceae bacterium]